MADKLTPLIIDALTRAAADPAGAPLYASKSEGGLFPNVSAAKPAVKKCLDDGLLHLCRTDLKGKAARELYAPTEKGLTYLVEHASPKEVIDDFVRILEERRGEVRALVGEAKRIADGIEGLMGVISSLVSLSPGGASLGRNSSPLGERVGGEGDSSHVDPIPPHPHPQPLSPRGEWSQKYSLPQGRGGPSQDLPVFLLAALRHWFASATVARDCPLPDLYAALPTRPALGEFHDALRQLHADGRVYLHPWTAPLYELPAPPFALLVGHEIAYYVSPR